ncbi:MULTISPECIES: aldo/keto reductase [Streptomyces]|uniref:Aldo/keto reductase n=1 Tax=Streptomyces eurythermus TaxID=42237 RepID=A0ABW6Z9C9_9ACTN|nr:MULTISPECIES: aldo/keto reductase [Streptomyces]QIS75115.1 aldo/keto reductase [Streptomyces sp. DSM 40868]
MTSHTLHTGLVALGTFEYGSTVPPGQARQLLDTFCALGGQIIDTAPTYGPTSGGCQAEALIGRWLAASGASAAVVSKAGLDPARPERGILDPAALIASAHRSAETLGRPLTGLLWHRDDPAVPVGEIADAAHQLVTDGTTRYVGASNWTTSRLEAWIRYADRNQLARPRISQPLWSLARRAQPPAEPWLVEAGPDHLNLAASAGLTLMPYRTLAAGYLTDAHSGRHAAHHQATYATTDNTVRRERLRAAAVRLGVSVPGLALACLRASTRARVVPVIGPRTTGQLHEVLNGAGTVISPDLAAHLAGGQT